MNEHEQLLTDVLKCSRTDLHTRSPQLSHEQSSKLDAMLCRRKSGEPLQYILGHTSFMGLTLMCDERALIPRPETEILIETVVASLRQGGRDSALRILDLGTGTGNIAVALCTLLESSTVISVDVSSEAIDLARLNVERHGFNQRVQLVHADMKDFLGNARAIAQQFDVIISNPPYIPDSFMDQLPEDVRREPSLALKGGHDGLDFYRAILADAPLILSDDGLIALECWDGQAKDILNLGQAAGLNGRSYQDYTQVERGILFSKT